MAGYVYIKDWDRYQHYKNRRPPWIKFYVDLLGNDAWLDLSPSNVKLLCVLWMLAATHGNGRVTADERWLTGQAKSRKGSLKALVDAGFIEVRASKAASALGVPEGETETDIPLTPINGGTVNHLQAVEPAPIVDEPPRKQTRAERQAEEANQKRLRAVIACRRVWRNAEEDGENMDALHESLSRDYRHDLSIVADAIAENGVLRGHKAEQEHEAVVPECDGNAA